MRKLFRSFLLLSLVIGFSGCAPGEDSPSIELQSPNSALQLEFLLTDEGQPAYTLSHQNSPVIDTSTLGFDLRNAPVLAKNFQILNRQVESHSESYALPWGEQDSVFSQYNELRVELQEMVNPKRKLNLVFRLFNDGLGFRTEFPRQDSLSSVVIMDENTQFQLIGDHTCWWIPGDWDIYEHLYNQTPFSQIDALSKAKHVNLAQTYIPYNAVNTPVTMRTQAGLHLSFHEANLTNYAGMTLKIDPEQLRMTSELVGSPDSSKVKRELPFVTPWRTIQVTKKATELIDSKLILNLNEPIRLGDVSWFQPTKYMGIWWEMHIGKATWDKASGKHGATTENTKRYIDFAAENGIGGILVEGWNTGWEYWFGTDTREFAFDFTTPYEDYDLKGLAAYALEKGIQLIMHNETSSSVLNYEKHMEKAFQLYQSLGIHAIKTGYVGTIIPKGEFHHGQFMVNHYRKVLETAAKYQLAINAHEPIKATGIRRTLPNAIAREGLRGQEFNAWASDGGNPPEHLTIVPFTRMLAGPIDFTPGIFNIKLDPWKENNQINTTLAQQLALYVVLYSPVQMAADLPEYYEGHPAFQFIKDVGVNWSETKVLAGEVGEYVVIARRERGSKNWFIGAVTDEKARNIELKLDFLEKGLSYDSQLYIDGKDAHWQENPLAYSIEKKDLSAGATLNLQLAPGGGAAISLFAPPTE